MGMPSADDLLVELEQLAVADEVEKVQRFFVSVASDACFGSSGINN